MPWIVKKGICLPFILLLLLAFSNVGWSATTSSATPTSYTVQSGDSLYSIGKKFGISVDQLVQLNSIGNPSLIKPGTKLILQAPVTPPVSPGVESVQGSASTATVAIPQPKQVASYTVQAGDTLWAISRKTAVSVADLLQINNIRENTILQPGQVLHLDPKQSTVASTPAPNTSSTPSKTSQAVVPVVTPMGSMMVPIPMQVPAPVVSSSASSGQQIETQTHSQETVYPGDELKAVVSPSANNTVPHVISSDVDRAREVLNRVTDPTENMQWPVTGRLTSKFGSRWGRMHEGIDLSVPTGTPVRAAAEGAVTFAGWYGGYGYFVIVDHGNGWETCYAHNSELRVAVGDTVLKGDVISRSGNTGNTTGPHLHFEIRKDAKPLDPLRYLP